MAARRLKRLKRDIESESSSVASASFTSAGAEAGETLLRQGARPRRGWLWPVVAVLALFGGLVIGVFLGRRVENPPSLTFDRLTFQRGTIFAARSPRTANPSSTAPHGSGVQLRFIPSAPSTAQSWQAWA
jgi:hypothetical protein